LDERDARRPGRRRRTNLGPARGLPGATRVARAREPSSPARPGRAAPRLRPRVPAPLDDRRRPAGTLDPGSCDRAARPGGSRRTGTTACAAGPPGEVNGQFDRPIDPSNDRSPGAAVYTSWLSALPT